MSPQAQAAPTMFEAALDYARCGIPVFPCNPIDKRPLTASGFKDATRDETQILTWWQQYPNGMIGVPMGPAIVSIHEKRAALQDGIKAMAPRGTGSERTRRRDRL